MVEKSNPSEGPKEADRRNGVGSVVLIGVIAFLLVEVSLFALNSFVWKSFHLGSRMGLALAVAASVVAGVGGILAAKAYSRVQLRRLEKRT